MDHNTTRQSQKDFWPDQELVEGSQRMRISGHFAWWCSGVQHFHLRTLWQKKMKSQASVDE